MTQKIIVTGLLGLLTSTAQANFNCSSSDGGSSFALSEPQPSQHVYRGTLTAGGKADHYQALPSELLNSSLMESYTYNLWAGLAIGDADGTLTIRYFNHSHCGRGACIPVDENLPGAKKYSGQLELGGKTTFFTCEET